MCLKKVLLLDKVMDALNVGKSNLISAKALFEIGQYRDSVTMSYYAMYSAALALLLKKDISPGTHGGTMRQLAKEYVKPGLLSKQTYEFLNGGMADRNKSSYDYSAVFSEEIAEKYICKAERFINEAETLI